jgi:hypothetical protein
MTIEPASAHADGMEQDDHGDGLTINGSSSSPD